MRIPQEQKIDAAQSAQDKTQYDYWFRHQFGADNKDDTQKIYNAIYKSVQLELSEKQREYLVKYYFEGLTIREIAVECGINISTVSRTIARGRRRLERVLKYVDPRLMRLFEKAEREGGNNGQGGS